MKGLLINMLNKTYRIHKETIHNFLWRSLQTLGKQGITFFIFLLSAKMLSPYEFGIFNYVLAIIFLLVIFSDFGISTATSKFIVEYNVSDKEKVRLVLFNSGIIIFFFAAIISIIMFFFGRYYLGDKYLYVSYLLPLIFLVPITSLYDGIYRGIKQFKFVAIISLIVGIISLIFVYILIERFGLMGALISQNLFYLLLFLALGFGYRDFCLKVDKEVIKDIGKYSLVIGIGSIGYILYFRIDTLFLGYYGYIIELGYLEIINKLFSMIVIPLYIFSQVIAPNITRYFARKEYKIVLKKYIKFILLSFILAIIITSLSYLLLPLLLDVFLKKYSNLIMLQMFNLMMPILFVALFTGIIPQSFIIPTGHYKIITILFLIFGLLKIILNYIFINSIGYIGIIYSSIIVVFFSNMLILILYYNKLKEKVNES